jgi:hypothetical protein
MSGSLREQSVDGFEGSKWRAVSGGLREQLVEVIE